ncbi:AraC family transcriptional regulator [Limnobacter parvus]|uniref:AraC family transcriptional regulator n=1 Tax=Limnobacter parvus TaxID=2939690 RepID=A0ABT1XII9_9BURK|nr:AraC family transcriptional regulator [Limnobacter parvus]MCR2745909.1 AraC family transcriptional regulator [Limnobacter parvus]
MTNKTASSTSNTPTALASWMRGLARELELQGCNAPELFAQAGLDFALLDSPEARYPVPQTTLLWQKAVQATGDETLGIRAIRHITPATFHAVGLSVMASETLEQAFGRMRRFAELVTDASEFILLTTQSEFTIELKIKEGAQPAHQSTDGFMCLLANAGKGLGDPSLVPLRIELRRPAPQADNLDFFEKSFAAPLRFDCNTFRIVYELATVRTRLKGANPLIAEHLDQASQAAIERLKPASSVSRMVKTWVAQQLAQGAPSIEEVAAYMNMSSRNLQRKLAEEGTSLAAIVDEIRQTEAQRRLKQSQDSLTAIALDLGFSDASAFSRACKRWFGKSPSDIRGA